MPANLTRLNQLIQGDLLEKIATAFGNAAVNTEDWIRQNHAWQDDTGSLSASTTGYVEDNGALQGGSPLNDPHKNFGDPVWRDAQRGVKPSHYLLKYPQNTPDHYLPFEQDISTPEITAVVTAFVEYGMEVEADLNVGDTFSRALSVLEQEIRNARITI